MLDFNSANVVTHEHSLHCFILQYIWLITILSIASLHKRVIHKCIKMFGETKRERGVSQWKSTRSIIRKFRGQGVVV